MSWEPNPIDCTCAVPGGGDREHPEWCDRCGGFSCPYAEVGLTRCPTWRCDCFIDSYPDDPMGLHPEAYMVIDTPPSHPPPR